MFDGINDCCLGEFSSLSIFCLGKMFKIKLIIEYCDVFFWLFKLEKIRCVE